MTAFRVMTFNLLYGGGDRFDRILEVIGEARPDLLVMQECQGWEDGSRLRRVAGVVGVPDDDHHRVLAEARPRGSGKRYHLGVVSREPILRTTVYNDPHFIGHALVRCDLEVGGAPLTFFGAHYDASHENLRFVEARYLRSVVDPADFQAGRYLLAGDLNSLSRRDPYPDDLARLVERSGNVKYGLPPRFEVIDDLEAFGWIDTLRHLPGPRPWVTARRNRGGVVIDFRTDYIFASPGLIGCLEDAWMVEVGTASDHNPLLATFRI